MSDIVDRLKGITTYGDSMFDNILRDAATEIERLRSLVEWKAVETDEPPHATELLLYSPPWSHGRARIEVACASTGRRTVCGNGREVVSNISFHGSATHWLPLPPPPESKP